MIRDNLAGLNAVLPANVTLVVVSKMQPLHYIREAYDAGQRRFAENRVQDLIARQPELPGDIEWHFIGHLQTNKVRFIAPFISMIQSVDSLKLVNEIDREAAKNHRIIRCMLEIFVASEETKYGLGIDEARAILSSDEYKAMHNIEITGLMGMATFTDDTLQVRNEFRKLKSCFDQLKEEFFRNDDRFCQISMGMSGDYAIAIEEGSTMVRIGTRVFEQ
jgi:PLP dependent protein